MLALRLLMAIMASHASATQTDTCHTEPKDFPCLLQTGWFAGHWHKSGLSWPEEEKTGEKHAFILTWGAGSSGATPLNVSEAAAVKAAGPLTLLRVLQLHGSDPKSAFAKVIKEARRVGRVRLHILGVSKRLEPVMAWDKFLMGPLGDEEKHLVKAFDLPKTPFAGMEVSIIFNGMKDQRDKEFSKEELRRLRGTFAPGYHEEFRGGEYHEVVNEIPDFAMAMNAGLAHYPTTWYPTISLLRRQQVPVIVTGYGGHLGHIYEYDQRLVPKFNGDSLQLPNLPRSDKWTVTKVQEHFPGFELAGGSDARIKMKEFKDDDGHYIESRHLLSLDNDANAGISALLVGGGGGLESKHNQAACSDAQGTLYMAGRTDFDVKLAAKNPFTFCDPNHDMHCNANGVVVLLEPGKRAASEISREPPQGLFHDALSKFVPCFPHKVQRCLTKHLSKWDGLSLIDDFFDKAIKACKW